MCPPGHERLKNSARMTPSEVRVLLLAVCAAMTGCGEGRLPEDDPAGAEVAAMSLHEQAAHTVAARLHTENGVLTPALAAELATGAAAAVMLPAGIDTTVLSTARSAAPWAILAVVEMQGISALPPPVWFAALADAEALREAGAEAAEESRRAGGDLLAIDLGSMNGEAPLGALRFDPEQFQEGSAAFVRGATEAGAGVVVSPFLAETGGGALLRWDRARLATRELRELERVIGAGAVASFIVTGNLRDVMKESISAAASPLKSVPA